MAEEVRQEDADTSAEGSGWFGESAPVPFWGPMAIKFLKLNRIPRHIAFIMDGNRRYAHSNNMGSVVKGHFRGFDQLTKVLDWCNQLGVREITCYAFSIENFKRSKEEVDGLLQMAEQKFTRLLEEKEKLAERQVKFRFFGNLDRLPTKLQCLMAEIELYTKDFDRAFLNVCLSYTSQDEIVRGMEKIRQAKNDGIIQEEDITEDLLNHSLDTGSSLPVDMLIRTSGEKRLSDFLLWQTSTKECFLHFDDVLWPDFDFPHLFKAILRYQMHVITQGIVEQKVKETETIRRFREYQQTLRHQKWEQLLAQQA
ncbi:unnamed protein product [Bursaphelenchus xylophilus]|uniref:Alkyl transferase n=1 Tax=Bursaphelenchus xylophilus TaxID=6326 RepID=A0A1I7SLA3_BURXY|nr:unnamed protein product [Bursaphelenchus xylophilus]CAG9129443.1 unnamed protein product [Bursaphelenchus xylophilus]